MPPVAYYIRRQWRRPPTCKSCRCELRVGETANYRPISRWLICPEYFES
jgi:hypothetical protein